MPGATVVKMASILNSQIGLREGPANNETPFGKWYNFDKVAWCAIFLSWGSAHGGAMYLGRPWRFASTVTARDHAKRNKRWTTTPVVGSIAMLASSSTTGHVGFVTGIYSNGDIETVEGNTNAQGAREGNGVWRRRRSRGQWDGYIILDETYGSVPPIEPPKPPPVIAQSVHFYTGDNMVKGAMILTSKGKMIPLGEAPHYGDPSGIKLNGTPVDFDFTPSGLGYYIACDDGGVLGYGRAPFYGSAGGVRLTKPVVGIAVTPSGAGYGLVGADGGLFCYGDMPFLGSLGGVPLRAPIVGLALTPTGKGYWMVAADGGVFAYGDAGFYGSAAEWKLQGLITGISVTSTGKGYWLFGADGGIFAFGDAKAYPSFSGKLAPDRYVTDGLADPDGSGVVVLQEEGGVLVTGSEVPFFGSAVGKV